MPFFLALPTGGSFFCRGSDCVRRSLGEGGRLPSTILLNLSTIKPGSFHTHVQAHRPYLCPIKARRSPYWYNCQVTLPTAKAATCIETRIILPLPGHCFPCDTAFSSFPPRGGRLGRGDKKYANYCITRAKTLTKPRKNALFSKQCYWNKKIKRKKRKNGPD